MQVLHLNIKAKSKIPVSNYPGKNQSVKFQMMQKKMCQISNDPGKI